MLIQRVEELCHWQKSGDLNISIGEIVEGKVSPEKARICASFIKNVGIPTLWSTKENNAQKRPIDKQRDIHGRKRRRTYQSHPPSSTTRTAS